MRIFTLDWVSAPDHRKDGVCGETGILLYGLCDEGTKHKKIIKGFSFRFWVMLRSSSDMPELSGMLKNVRNIGICEDSSFGSVEIERFRGKTQLFARLSSTCATCLHQAYSTLRRTRWNAETAIETFEGSMSATTRLLQVLQMRPHVWVEVPMSETIRYTDIFGCADEATPRALCAAAFDIECLSDDCASFPDAERPLDTMEQIGLVLSYPFSSHEGTSYMFTLKEITSPNMIVVKCETERQMWEEFKSVIDSKVHVLTSYNGFAFDFPYMITRCELQNEDIFKKEFSTAAFGCQSFTFVEFEGVAQIDMLVHLRKEKKLESYKLDDVAEQFLGMKKHDVTPQQIFSGLKHGGSDERQRIAEYCIQDCRLVIELMRKFQVLESTLAMCQVTACPIKKIVVTGQQARTLDLLSQRLYTQRLLLPDRPLHAVGPDDDTYTGATVLEAKAGLYTDPVAGLDFASLYPSIMIAKNLCVSTRHPDVPDDPDAFHNVDGVYYRKQPMGVFPEVLAYLWKTRKATRSLMKGETNEDTISILNARQLSYKLVMNSIYGTLGSRFFPIESQSIAKGVTWFGRQLLHDTQEMIVKKYPEICEIVYGDSVTGETPVATEDGPIAIADLAGRWQRYRHIDPVQQRLGRARNKQIALPAREVRVRTSSGLQELQHLVRRRHRGLMYMVMLSDGTSMRMTGDHAVWHNHAWLAAKDLRVGMVL